MGRKTIKKGGVNNTLYPPRSWRNNRSRQPSRSLRSNRPRQPSRSWRNNTPRQPSRSWRNNTPRQPSRSWRNNTPRQPSRNSTLKNKRYVPPGRRNDARKNQITGVTPVLKRGVTGNNIIRQMNNTAKTRNGQGGDIYINHLGLANHDIHNNTQPGILKYPHHHISPHHLAKQTPGKTNNPSFRGNILLIASTGDTIKLSVRTTYDNTLRILFNDRDEVVRTKTNSLIDRTLLNSFRNYRTLNINQDSENRLINYIKTVLKIHYLLIKAISDLV